MLLRENLKAASDISQFLFTRLKFLGHMIESTTITPSTHVQPEHVL